MKNCNERLEGLITGKPTLARALGKVMFSLGGFLLICGLIGRAALGAIDAGRARASLPAFGTIFDAYPTYSLWFVPQSAFGYVLPALLAAFGIYLALSERAACKTPSNRHRECKAAYCNAGVIKAGGSAGDDWSD